MRPFTHANLDDVPDVAAAAGFGEIGEARFANDELESEQTGLSHHRLKPGRRQAFGHRHEEAEEIYFVVSGSGRAKLDDAVVELRVRDVIRVAPGVMRAFEGGDEGLELLAFGPRRPDDRGEIAGGWWDEDELAARR